LRPTTLEPVHQNRNTTPNHSPGGPPMRKAATAACALIGATVLASAQEAPKFTTEPPPRFGVAPRLKSFPQNTAKAALQSAIEAVEGGQYAYLLAHLMDPQFVDARVADR